MALAGLQSDKEEGGDLFFFKKQIHISFSRLFIVVVLCLVVCYLPFVALISLLPRALKSSSFEYSLQVFGLC
jgi:hypothetical protein